MYQFEQIDPNSFDINLYLCLSLYLFLGVAPGLIGPFPLLLSSGHLISIQKNASPAARTTIYTTTYYYIHIGTGVDVLVPLPMNIPPDIEDLE